MNEAAWAGVPLVAIPLFADQLYNAALARWKGVGELVDIRQMASGNGEPLSEALEAILSNGQNSNSRQASHSQNAQMLSRKLKGTPFSPAERLVKWVEFVAEMAPSGDHPLAELNLPGYADLGDSWWWWWWWGVVVYHSLDVIFASALLLLVAFCLCAIVLKRIFGIFMAKFLGN